MSVLLNSEKSMYVKNWIYKFDYNFKNASFLFKKKLFAKFGPFYRVQFDQTEKEKTNKQKFQKWS